MLIKAYQAIGFNLYACEMCSYLEKNATNNKCEKEKQNDKPKFIGGIGERVIWFYIFI